MSLLLRQSAYDGTSDGSGASLLPSSSLRPQSPPRPSSPPSLQLPPPQQQSSSHVRRRRQRYARPQQHRRVPQPLPLSPPPPLLLLRGRGAHTARPRRASVAALRIGTDRHRRDSIATQHTTHSSSSSSDAETSVASGSDDDDTHEHESACSDNNNSNNNNDDEDDAATRGASVLLAQTMTSTSSSSLTLVSCSSRGSVSVPLPPPPPPPVLRRLAAAASASALSLSSSLSSSAAAAPRLRVTRTNALRHNATVAAATTATTTARQRPPCVLTLPVTSAPHRQAQQQRPQQHATPSAHVSWSAKQLTSHRRCLASTHASCPLLGKHNTRIIATATAATAADAAGATMTRTTRTATRAYAARVVHHEGDDDNDDDDITHATLLPLPRLRVRAAYARHGNDYDDDSSSRRTADIHSSDDDDGSNTSSNSSSRSSNSTCSDDDDDATAAFHFFTPLSPCPTSTAPRFDVVACAAASAAKRTAASAAAATMAATALPSSSPPRRQEQQTCVTWPASCDDDEDNDDDNSNSKGDSNDSSERDVHVVSSTDAVTKQRQPTPPPQPTSSCAYALLPLPRFIAHVDDNKTAHAPARHAATAHYATLPSLSSLTRSAATTTTTAATATTTTVAVPHGGACRPASHHAATPVRPLAAATATRDVTCDARVHAAVADASSGRECDGSGAVMAVAVVTGNARTRTQRADRASDHHHNNDDRNDDNGDACDGRRVVPGGVAAADERLQTLFAYASLQGHRTHQEDHVLLLPSLQLPVPLSSSSCEASALLVRCFGVFDGHGGDVVARLASRCFAEHFLLALQQHYATYNTPLPQQQQQQQQQQHDDNADSTRALQHRLLSASLVQTLLHVDVTIRDVLPPTQHGAGATACVAACYAPPPSQQHTTAATTTTTTTPCRVSCAATDSRCRVVTLGDGVDSLVLSLANLGDSRAVLGRVATRALLLETRDHRLARNAAERARVLRCGGVVEVGGVDGVLDVTRGLGDYRWKSAPAQWWAACAHEDNNDSDNDNDNKDNDDDVQTKATRRGNDADTRTTCGNVISNIADVYECDVHAGEFLLIASDGVWDYVSSIAAVRFIADTLATLVDDGDGGEDNDDASGEQRERLPSPSPLCVDNDNDVVSAYVRDEGNGNVAAETTAVATHLPSCTPRLHANDHDDNDATVQRPAHVPLQQMLPYNVGDMAWPWLPASSHRARTHDTNMTTTTTTPLPRLCLPPCAVSGSTPPSSPSLLAPLPSARSVASDASDVAAAAASSSSSSTSDTPRSTDGGEAWRDMQTPRDTTATRVARHETQQQQHRQHARRPPSPAPAARLQCAVRRFTQYILHECGSRDNITVVLVYFARGSDTNDDDDTQ